MLALAPVAQHSTTLPTIAVEPTATPIVNIPEMEARVVAINRILDKSDLNLETLDWSSMSLEELQSVDNYRQELRFELFTLEDRIVKALRAN